ncbi:hypothetical protein [Marinimicrobium sp. ABcell2]|uniref:hypothetical protein n=1 Tax=Marinimicrobium sp. ABcell2 TaxID=3069751 RepID=UPI0027B7F2A4|nr:hypothetical protein [Marinimicrobium sp. ABcell2]MDQ2077380.1 hypothetical protein [Marinimicrobium sp. ABcell2]
MSDPVLALVLGEIRNETASVFEFHNGCWLSLPAVDGMYWGSTPYGIDWGCNAGSGAPQAICTWVQFWNDNRDEAGRLISE